MLKLVASKFESYFARREEQWNEKTTCYGILQFNQLSICFVNNTSLGDLAPDRTLTDSEFSRAVPVDDPMGKIK